MIDVHALRKDIKSSGLKIRYIANQMGLSYQAFYNKMNGKTEFTSSEIADYAIIRGKQLKEILPIFFTNKVD